MKPLLMRVALALTAAALVLLIGELATRLFDTMPRYHGAGLELHPELGFAGIPGFRSEHEVGGEPVLVEYNEEGFRGPLMSESRGAGGVLMLGDSFLVGEAIGREDLVSERVARKWGEAGSVHNLGVVDYGTGQQLLLLRRYGERLAPSAIVLFLYPGNDVANNSRALAGATSVGPGNYVRAYLDGKDGGVRWVHPVRAFFRTRSRLFARVELGVVAAATARGYSVLPRPLSTVERLRAGRVARPALEIFVGHDPRDPWELAWKQTHALLRGIRDESAALGARLLVMVIPTAEQVQRTAHFQTTDALTRLYTGRGAEAQIDWNAPEQRLRRFFREEEMQAWLLLPEFREIVAEGRVLYTRDKHLNALGHQRMAEDVLRWLGGEAPPPLDRRIKGRPVARLPRLADAPRRRDFGDAPSYGDIGDGWIRWRPAGDADPDSGWLLGQRGVFLLPALEGALRVRVRASREGPFRGALELGAREIPFELAAGERRDVRVDASLSEGPRTTDHYVPVVIDAKNAIGRLWLEGWEIDPAP